MRRIRDVLTGVYEKRLSLRKCSKYTGVSRTSVQEYMERFQRSGLSWPLSPEIDDQALEEALFPSVKVIALINNAAIDFEKLHSELQMKGATLAVLHNEWLQETPKELHLSYSQFCRSYKDFRKTLRISMRRVETYGEVVYVDYSGATIEIADRKGGPDRTAQVFIGVLGGSNYTFCEVTWSQRSWDWLASHVRMFEFFGGVPRIIVPDNLKPAVTLANASSPVVNETYFALCRHYGILPFPARPRTPKDKARAEGGVLLAQRWILFVLRKRKFFSLEEANREIRTLLEKLNSRPFQKLQGCRLTKWLEHERATLSELPAQMYELAEWGKVRAGLDYHVRIDRHHYSVPYKLKGEQFEYRMTATAIDLLFKGNCVTLHQRSFEIDGTTTLKEHRHPAHSAVSDWNEEDAMNWAREIGENTAALLQIQLNKIRGYYLGYRSTQSLKSLVKIFGNVRMEEACAYAVKYKATSASELRDILSKKLDLLLSNDTADDHSVEIIHENIRGSKYYDELIESNKGESHDE